MGNLTSVDQVHGDEALVELCDESLSANMATTQMKILTYLILVILFTRAKFLDNKIYTEKTRKLRQNTQ